MGKSGKRIFKVLRKPMGWTAAYVLVLQLVLGGFAGAQFSAHAADQNWSFFEICYGKGSQDGEVPSGQPAKQASKSFGCVVCANAVGAPPPEAPGVLPLEFSLIAIEWTIYDDRIVVQKFFSAQRQRAPPFQA